MKRIMTVLAVLVAFGVLASRVTAAEPGTQPAGQMEEVNLDAEAPDIEADAFDSEDQYDSDDGLTFDFIINAIPAALLIDMNGNNFGLTDDSGRRSTASSIYMMPNIAVGVGAEVADRIYIDGMVGAGLLVNESLRSFLVQGTVSATYAASQSLSIGPRIGLIQFLGTEWLDDAELFDEVDFKDTTGLMLGLQIAMGDRVRYLVNIDYIRADFDIDNLPAGVTSDDPLELQGLAVQFGVRGEF